MNSWERVRQSGTLYLFVNYIYIYLFIYTGLPWWLRWSRIACDAGDLGSIPGLGRSPGGGHGNPLQYSCLENPMDRGAWWATVHAGAKSRTRLRDFHSFLYCSLHWAFTVVCVLLAAACGLLSCCRAWIQ